MYINELSEKLIDFESVFLDPNNPRFWSEKTQKDTPDHKIADSNIQKNAFDRMMGHGIQELSESILRNGFLPLDRIVVREIKGVSDKYVVVEGNRRLSALTLLRKNIEDEAIDEENISDDYLENLKKSTDKLNVLVYNGSDTDDIAWLLQGVRHIGGVREWQPAQRAKLVVDQIDNHGLGFKQAGQQFGLTAQAVGRLYRSYKALAQMREDDEYQSLAKNEWFSLFEEAIRNQNVKSWLGWSDQNYKFENIENLHQFYSWIAPDQEDTDRRRRIHDPKQIKRLGVLVDGKHSALLAQVDDHAISIDTAYDRAVSTPDQYDWKEALNNVEEILKSVPIEAIQSNPAEYVDHLQSIISSAEMSLKMAKAIME